MCEKRLLTFVSNVNRIYVETVLSTKPHKFNKWQEEKKSAQRERLVTIVITEHQESRVFQKPSENTCFFLKRKF